MSEHDPLDLQGQEKQQTEAHDRIKLAALTEVEDIKWLMQSKRGRRIVHRILTRAGVGQISFNTNALLMAFAEGRRNEGNALLASVLEHCPDRYIDMIKGQ